MDNIEVLKSTKKSTMVKSTIIIKILSYHYNNKFHYHKGMDRISGLAGFQTSLISGFWQNIYRYGIRSDMWDGYPAFLNIISSSSPYFILVLIFVFEYFKSKFLSWISGPRRISVCRISVGRISGKNLVHPYNNHGT